MSGQLSTSAEPVQHQHEGAQTTERQQYRQTVGPHWSDSEGEENPTRPSSHGRSRGINASGEPLSPPPPYSEQDKSPGSGKVWLEERINLRPGVGDTAEYVVDDSGHRQRYVIDGFGDRVPWFYEDHYDSEDDDEDSDMVCLESGRKLPRSEWETQHPTEYSSDEMMDDRQPSTSPSHRGSRPQKRPTEELQDLAVETESGERRQSLAGRGGHGMRKISPSANPS